MKITLEKAPESEHVTILGLEGDIDASNFEDVIQKAKEAHEAGSQNILVDMKKVNFMSSSGLVALHSIALLVRGEQPHDLESGWEVFHAIDRDRDSGIQPHVKILNPQPKVEETLKKTGMDAFFEIHMDLRTALDSFGTP